MRTFIALVAAAAMAGAAWLTTTRFEIRGLEDVRLAPKFATPESKPMGVETPNPAPGMERLRIASLDLGEFDQVKAAMPHVVERLARSVREFDVIGLQGIGPPGDELASRLEAAASTAGRTYEHLLSPVVGPPAGRKQYAFLFNTQTVEVDHTETYLVNDPHDRLQSDPFVVWFRAAGVRPETAFTFTLVAVRADRERTPEELDALADVFTRVREDGRGEDDVILLGNLNTDDSNLGRLGDLPRVACAISGIPTNTRGDRQLENLVFDHRATNEFTGRIGVFDFLREFNLTLSDAVAISEHLPIWAEFSVYEGGRPKPTARIAAPAVPYEAR